MEQTYNVEGRGQMKCIVQCFDLIQKETCVGDITLERAKYSHTATLQSIMRPVEVMMLTRTPAEEHTSSRPLSQGFLGLHFSASTESLLARIAPPVPPQQRTKQG